MTEVYLEIVRSIDLVSRFVAEDESENEKFWKDRIEFLKSCLLALEKEK